jgi:tRNA(Arg) A34 adenosine deaminase TadA
MAVRFIRNNNNNDDNNHQQPTQKISNDISLMNNRKNGTMSNKIDDSPLKGFELYGWSPDPSLSRDDNLMDLTLLVTRNSKLINGSMACILVREDDNKSSIESDIISVANNMPLFIENQSDIHAEVAAIGAACKRGLSTDKMTAYITMPPCKRCLGLLVAAGVKRIVTRRDPPQLLKDVAIKHNISFVTLSNHTEQQARINTLIHGDPQWNNMKRDQSTCAENNDGNDHSGSKKQKW